MNDQTIHELDKVIRLNPKDAAVYLNRGYAYYKKGEYDKAIEDLDNVVRLCPNYETDFIDSNFVHGGMVAVEAAIKLLNSKVNTLFGSADDFYYTGVRALLLNERNIAQAYFEKVLDLGYVDHSKVKEYLADLK